MTGEEIGAGQSADKVRDRKNRTDIKISSNFGFPGLQTARRFTYFGNENGPAPALCGGEAVLSIDRACDGVAR